MRILAIAAGLVLASGVFGDVSQCACDAATPQSASARECGLCREADKQPAEPQIFFLKDINPRKPNRWLALPRWHGKGGHALADMTPEQRLLLWSAAIEKGKELWGDKWGVAMNGDRTRTQCHAHLHIGKLLDGIETANFIVVNGPGEVPVPEEGSGLWVHADGNRLHVHYGEQLTETVLLR